MHILPNIISTVKIGLHAALYRLSRTERLYFFFILTTNSPISVIAAEVDNRRAWSATYTRTNGYSEKYRVVLSRFDDYWKYRGIVPSHTKVDDTDKTKVVQTETKISGKIIGYLVGS